MLIVFEVENFRKEFQILNTPCIEAGRIAGNGVLRKSLPRYGTPCRLVVTVLACLLHRYKIRMPVT